ncbi:MAG: flagellar basal body-associated FliL family protein [Actinomycetota bacterium]|jgi:flagellar FliL protein|nr:flagellar basal body-associated FliL family protein [Actinomycetota bacterium]
MTATLTPPQATSGDGEPPAEGATKKGGAKKLLIIVVAAVVVLGAAFELVLKPMLFPPHYRPGQPVPAGQIVSLPQNTINLSDGHLLQVTVALQLTAPASPTAIAKDDPKFLNAELTVFGALTQPDLLNPAGRTAAQAALLQAFQQIAGTSEGAQQISAIYFTNFITQ